MSNTRKVNPLEQHIEKLALLVAIVLLGWVAFAYWFNDPYTIELNGETVRPGQIDGKILEEVDNALSNIGSYVPGYSGQGYELKGFGWHQGFNDRINGFRRGVGIFRLHGSSSKTVRVAFACVAADSSNRRAVRI